MNRPGSTHQVPSSICGKPACLRGGIGIAQQGIHPGVEYGEPLVLLPQLLGFVLDLLGFALDLLGFALDLLRALLALLNPLLALARADLQP